MAKRTGRRSKGGWADLNAIQPRAEPGAAANRLPRIDLEQHRRQLLADLCRLLGQRLNEEISTAPQTAQLIQPSRQDSQPLPDLSPRMRQTLDRLLSGDSEKQIAHHMGVSRHTVHVYVKAIYRGFGVSSRGELLSKFVRR